jgi:hypothetical protein
LSSVEREWNDRSCRRDRRDDSHGSDRHPAVERCQSDQSGDARAAGRKELDDARERVSGEHDPQRDAHEPDDL